MTADRRLPEPSFPAVDAATWVATAGGSDPAALAKDSADGLRVEALYPTPFEATTGAALRPAAWAVAQQYAMPSVAAVAEALALDVGFGLDSAWVRLDGALRAGGAFGRDVGVRLERSDDVRKLVDAAGDATLWFEAGLGSDELEAWWRDVGRGGGPLYDPFGPLLELGGLGVELPDAFAGVRRGVGARPRSILVDGSVFHDRGAAAGQELGLVFAAVLELLASGGSEAEVAGSLVLRLVMDPDPFVSLSKARAARWLFSCLTTKMGGPIAPIHLCGRTARRNRSRVDPWVNMLRGTVETFAGVVGGVDEMIGDPFSSSLGVPRADARRWALGTGAVLRDESHLAHVLDPAAGSGYVESLTRQLAESAWTLATDLTEAGGLSEAITSGRVRDMLDEASAARLAQIDRGREHLTGVTLYPNLDESKVDVGPLPAPAGSLGLAPSVVAQAVPPVRWATDFEELRRVSDQYRDQTGTRPRAWLVVAGPPGPLRARIDFVRSLLAVGGFESDRVRLEDVEDGAPAVAVLCATDEDLPGLTADATSRLRAAGVQCVAVAGRDETVGDAAPSVDAFVFRGVNVPEVLERFQAAADVGGEA